MLPQRYQDRGNPMMQLRRELDRLFEGFFPMMPGMTLMPGMEIEPMMRSGLIETDDGFELELEMPGFDSRDVKIEMMGDVLSIRAEHQDEKSNGGEGRERLRGFRRFERSVSLPMGVDPNKVEARLERGILRVRLPRSESARPRAIEVKGSSEPVKGSKVQPAKQGKEAA